MEAERINKKRGTWGFRKGMDFRMKFRGWMPGWTEYTGRLNI